MEAATHGHEVVHAGGLEIRLDDGLVLAGGRAVALTVREFDLLVALVRRRPGTVRREALYAEAWGGRMRPADRSVDVYVRKLRVKLDEALPGWTFIHTHVGFGYRFDPAPSPPFHNPATGP